MGFRTLEISRAAELHIKGGQLEVTTEEAIRYLFGDVYIYDIIYINTIHTYSLLPAQNIICALW